MIIAQTKWPTRKLADCGQWVSGGTPSKATATYWNGDIPWISSKSLKSFNLTDSEDRITQAAVDNGTALVPAGTVIFVVRGMSLANEFRVGVTTRPVAFNQDLRAILPNSDIDGRFLTHYLRATQQVILGMASNSSHGTKRLPTEMIESVSVPVPPLPEQRRIATILDKADAIRRRRKEGIRLTEELLRSTFFETYGDPIANPKGWDVDKLGNVITFVGGSQPPKETFRSEPQDGYVRLVQIRDFKTDKYQTFIPSELARRSFVTDDVMIARYGPPVFQILRGLSGSYNVALMKAQPTERTTKDFIFYLLQTPAIHDTVVENSSRTAGQSGVNLELLNNLEIAIPPVSIQNDIGRSMRRIEEIKVLRQEACRESESLFGSLVQRAFRGEL